MTRLSTMRELGVLMMLAGAIVAPAQTHAPLQYHGGPVLGTFTIYPLYYGNWSNADIVAQQNYLNGLADYISGKNSPKNQQPMMRQYGVNTASVAPASAASPNASPAKLSRDQVLDIIHTNQANGNLPPYGGGSLLMVFLAKNFSVDVTGGCAYHGSVSPSFSYFAAVPLDCGPLFLVTAHEVFEASADPDVGYAPGWDEAVDDCTTTVLLPVTGLSLPGYAANTLPIPGAADNTQSGTCSTTGYTHIVSWEPCGKDDCGITTTPIDSNTTRIDLAKPVVTQASFPYNSIVFMSGDQIAIGAKGCVQTGGSGLTWKRYVDPSGPNSDRLYFGSMEVPGVLMPMRFSNINGLTIKVPSAEPPAKLVLYYSDDGYGDNGYYAHDNGTESQCFCPSLDATNCGVGTPGGPALVTLTITRNVSSPVTIGTVSLSDGKVGTAYSQSLTVNGGTAPFTWQLILGRLPFGLLLNTATGQISGTPINAVAGSFLTFKVTDSSSPMQTATVSFPITIAPAN